MSIQASKTKKYTTIFAATLLVSWPALSISSEIDFSGYVEAQNRYFYQDSLYPKQIDNQFSIALEPTWQTSFSDDKQILSFTPFYRWDEADSERSHADIRELMYIYVGDSWELHAGIGKVFWGVSESTHLVDIINQTDLVEAIDGEDKLGQPMIKLSLVRDWGILDLFALPGFRERTYQGPQGRFQFPLPIDNDNALYEDADEDQHIDFAVRWNNSLDYLDLALSYFTGTSREPEFIPTGANPAAPTQLTPFYPQIDQLGIEAQIVWQDWIFKTEAIRRSGELIDNYAALNSGFEYTFYGVWESVTDVGWLMEYQHHSRDDKATSPGQNDIFIGTRIAFNDAANSEILAGIAQDLDDTDTRSVVIEASTRVGESTVISFDAWIFNSDSPQNLAYNFRRDDFLQLTIQQYF